MVALSSNAHKAAKAGLRGDKVGAERRCVMGMSIREDAPWHPRCSAVSSRVSRPSSSCRPHAERPRCPRPSEWPGRVLPNCARWRSKSRWHRSRRQRGLNADLVADASHAHEVAYAVGGGLALVLPHHCARPGESALQHPWAQGRQGGFAGLCAIAPCVSWCARVRFRTDGSAQAPYKGCSITLVVVRTPMEAQ
jgi:hypothetical protein